MTSSNAKVFYLSEARDEELEGQDLSKGGQLFFPKGLPHSIHTWLQAAWASLASLDGFRAREQQIELSFKMAEEMIRAEKSSLVAEAPTGTGKTLAYLMASLAANKATGLPVVIGTATVTLQSQVINYDIPTLIKAGIAHPKEFVLAKGRGRYFCINSAMGVIATNNETVRGGAQTAFEGLESDEDEHTQFVKDTEELLDMSNSGEWDGDHDSLKQAGKYRKVWPLVACDSATCLKNECEYISKCSFWKARDEIIGAKVVVANHNLILNDLMLCQQSVSKEAEAFPDEDQSETTYKGVFPISGRYLAVFDEAHHLPDIASSVGATEFSFPAVEEDLKKIPRLMDRLLKSPMRQQMAVKKDLIDNSVPIGQILQKIRFSKSILDSLSLSEGANRVTRKELEKLVGAYSLLGLITDLEPELAGVCRMMMGVLDVCNAIVRKVDKSNPERSLCQGFASEASGILNVISAAQVTINQFLQQSENRVNWIEKKPDSIYSLCSTELEGSEVLNRILWTQNRIRSACFVSATLVGMGNSFDYFLKKAAVPEGSKTLKLKPIFNYENSELHTVKMDFKPGHELFNDELVINLKADIDKSKGNLILFNSRRSLKETYEKLLPVFGDLMISQHLMSPQKAIKAHKAAIDQGKGSILMGLATMAEGLDLPGAYCEFVAITWLPFGLPTDPRQEALKEKYGEFYFDKIVLPEAIVKLIQMVGRLLRREEDSGKIVVYDNRLYHSKYSDRMRKSLPPFKWIMRNHKNSKLGLYIEKDKGLLNQ